MERTKKVENENRILLKGVFDEFGWRKKWEGRAGQQLDKKKGYLSHKMVFFNSILVPISRLSE